MIPLRRVTRTRLAYFRGQLLDESDFRAEQDYHRHAWHLHNKKIHKWGVVDGLEVELHDDGKKVSVAPGMRQVTVTPRLESLTKDYGLDAAQQSSTRALLSLRRSKFIALYDGTPRPSIRLSRLAPLIERVGAPAK